MLLGWWCFQLSMFAVPTTLSYINIGIQSPVFITYTSCSFWPHLVCFTFSYFEYFSWHSFWSYSLFLLPYFLNTFFSHLHYFSLSPYLYPPLPWLTSHYFHLLSWHFFWYFDTFGCFHSLSRLLNNYGNQLCIMWWLPYPYMIFEYYPHLLLTQNILLTSTYAKTIHNMACAVDCTTSKVTFYCYSYCYIYCPCYCYLCNYKYCCC